MRMSFSSDKLLAFCPRKWQLLKLLNVGEEELGQLQEEEGGVSLAALYNNPSIVTPTSIVQARTSHTMYGSAFGAGAAMLLTSGGDIEQAIWTAFRAWDYRYESSPKYLQVLFTSLIRLHEQFNYSRYRPITLADGRPAVELGTRIWLDSEGKQDYYVLYTDIVLLDTHTNRPTIFEVKTTKRPSPLTPHYTNSPQTVLYSLPLFKIFPEYTEHAWNTVYVINQILDTWDPGIFLFDVEYSLEDRNSVLLSILLRYEQINRYRELSFFPKCASGECVTYSQICEFYSLCDSLPLTCSPLSLEEQNALSTERQSQIICDLHMQELLSIGVDSMLEQDND